MNYINLLDSLMGIMDVAEAIIKFSQREDVQRFFKRTITMLQALLLCLGLVLIIVLWFTAQVIKVIYREWQSAWPVAVAAFKEGYSGKTVSDVSTTVATVVELPQVANGKPKSETQRLREACTKAGIQWRNVRGKNKHATVIQMRQLLANVASA